MQPRAPWPSFPPNLFTFFPSNFTTLLLPTRSLTVRIRIPQLDERETLPIDAWLRESSLDFGAGSAAVTDAEAQTTGPARGDVSTNTDVTRCCDAATATDTMQMQDESAALAARVALEAEEKARMEEQQALMRSQFDAEVSGYQMQLSEVERAKDTQLVVQTSVIMAMLDILQLPEDFPAFPECSNDIRQSSNQLQQFLTAFQAHTELKNREQRALRDGHSAMQLELDDLKQHLQQLQLQHRLDTLNSSPLQSSSSQASVMPSHVPLALYCDATPSSMASGASSEEVEILRVREEGHRTFCAELEGSLRSAVLAQEEAKRERDHAVQQVAVLQQQMQDIMRDLRQQHEHPAGWSHPAPPPPRPSFLDSTLQAAPPPPRPVFLDSDAAGGAAAPARNSQQHERRTPEPLSPKHMCHSPPAFSPPAIVSRAAAHAPLPLAASWTLCWRSFWRWATNRSRHLCAPSRMCIASHRSISHVVAGRDCRHVSAGQSAELGRCCRALAEPVK